MASNPEAGYSPRILKLAMALESCQNSALSQSFTTYLIAKVSWTIYSGDLILYLVRQIHHANEL